MPYKRYLRDENVDIPVTTLNDRKRKSEDSNNQAHHVDEHVNHEHIETEHVLLSHSDYVTQDVELVGSPDEHMDETGEEPDEHIRESENDFVTQDIEHVDSPDEHMDETGEEPDEHIQESENDKTGTLEPPLYPGAKLTAAQSEALILAYIIRNGVSDVGLQHLLQLIDLHLPHSIYSTKYVFLKNLEIRNEGKEMFYCNECMKMMETGKKSEAGGKGENKFRVIATCRTDNCSQKDIDYDQSKLKKDGQYFIHIPIKEQLRQMLSNPNIAGKLRKNRSGVTSGEVYQTLMEEGKIGPNDFTLQFNTDGAAAFENSDRSIWPIQVGINELPYRERKKNVILAGLWLGAKPHMPCFFSPFVKELEDLHENGLELDDGTKVKVHCLMAPVDSVARPVMQNIKQYNGEHGCSYCLHPGERLEKGKGSNVRVFRGDVGPPRTLDQHVKDMTTATLTGKPVNGVKGPSIFMLIPLFHIIKSLPPDYMHNILLGVVKMFLCNWLDTANSDEPWFIGGRKYDILNDRLKRLNPSSEISRLTRDLKFRNKWKASEYRNFLVYYSLPILKNILPRKFYDHFSLLVYSVTVFLQERIDDSDFKSATDAITKFVLDTEKLYNRKTFMTYNMHVLLHVPDFVRYWGPLWDQSCFIYESYNGILLRLFKGSQYVSSQIVKNYYRILKLQEFVNNFKFPFESKSVEGNFFYTLVGNFISYNPTYQNEFKILGKFQMRELSVLERFLIQNYLKCPNVPREVKSYQRFTYKKTLFSSVHYERSKRVNAIARLVDSSIIEIDALIFVNDRYLLMGKELLPDKNATFNKYSSHIRNTKIMPTSVTKSDSLVTAVENIGKKCVFLTFDENEIFVVDLVNKLERD